MFISNLKQLTNLNSKWEEHCEQQHVDTDVYTEKIQKILKWDILWYITRERCITLVYTKL